MCKEWRLPEWSLKGQKDHSHYKNNQFIHLFGVIFMRICSFLIGYLVFTSISAYCQEPLGYKIKLPPIVINQIGKPADIQMFLAKQAKESGATWPATNLTGQSRLILPLIW